MPARATPLPLTPGCQPASRAARPTLSARPATAPPTKLSPTPRALLPFRWATTSLPLGRGILSGQFVKDLERPSGHEGHKDERLVGRSGKKVVTHLNGSKARGGGDNVVCRA